MPDKPHRNQIASEGRHREKHAWGGGAENPRSAKRPRHYIASVAPLNPMADAEKHARNASLCKSERMPAQRPAKNPEA